MKKRVYVRLIRPVPLELRQELHDAGAWQHDAQTWNIPMRGSGEWLVRLNKLELGADEVDELPKPVRRCGLGTLHTHSTMELELLAQRERESKNRRSMWRNG